MLLLSLFCLIPNNYHNVYAFDDVIATNFNFVSSKVFIPVSATRSSTGAYDDTYYNMLTLSFGLTDGVYSARVYGVSNDNNNTGTFTIDGVNSDVLNAEMALSRSSFLYAYINPQSDLNYRYNIFVYHSGQLSSNIIKVRFSSYVNLNPNIIKPADLYNTITYFDDNGEFIEFQFPLYSNVLNNQLLFNERYYYFTGSFTDNTFYEEGFEAGVEDGFNRGEQVGYENGYNAGNTIGYGNGYTDGLAQGGNYSFMGLIGAVIDAPVTAFTSLLNFNVFGVNILALVTGLLSIAIIVLIVKLCLGGR